MPVVAPSLTFVRNPLTNLLATPGSPSTRKCGPVPKDRPTVVQVLLDAGGLACRSLVGRVRPEDGFVYLRRAQLMVLERESE